MLQCHIACGQWVMEILRCTAALPGSIGQRKSCNALPQGLGAMGKKPLEGTYTMPALSMQRPSCNALPHCLGVVGSGNPILQRHTACGKWVVDIVRCTATLLGSIDRRKCCNAQAQCLAAMGKELLQGTYTLPAGSRRWTSCNALPQCLGVVGSGIAALHHHNARRQWAGSPCNAPPQCRGAVGSGAAAMHCRGAVGRDLLQCSATLLVGSGHWK